MNVLSLFDGLSCGQIALERTKINVDNYYASEIDKHAIKMFDGSVFDYDDNEKLKSERKKAKNRAIILVDYLIEDSKGGGYLGDHDKWLKVKKEIKNIRE
jgi:DNA (cytosine-5)-methyltransferase 3A